MKILSRQSLVALALLSLVGSAWSTPEEDYKRGQFAYQRGDVFDAFPPLKRAADAGHAEAQALYAYLLDQAYEPEEALKYYRLSAKAGNLEGMFGLASMYSTGGSTHRDEKEALRLFKDAAGKGHSQALIVVASAYLTGRLGLSEAELSSAEALDWVTRAAEKKHIESIQRLIRANTEGGFGLPPNASEAARWQKVLNEVQGVDPGAKKKRRGKS